MRLEGMTKYFVYRKDSREAKEKSRNRKIFAISAPLSFTFFTFFISAIIIRTWMSVSSKISSPNHRLDAL